MTESESPFSAKYPYTDNPHAANTTLPGTVPVSAVQKNSRPHSAPFIGYWQGKFILYL